MNYDESDALPSRLVHRGCGLVALWANRPGCPGTWKDIIKHTLSAAVRVFLIVGRILAFE
jgi:hypothetical protein